MNRRIEITKEQQKEMGLPKKAVGFWEVAWEKLENCYMWRLKADGTLGSKRADNHFLLPMGKFLKLAGPEPETPKARPPMTKPIIGSRKLKWVNCLLETLYEIPEIQPLLPDEGKVRQQILEDTEPQREGGKAYSSMTTAIACWKRRAKKEGC